VALELVMTTLNEFGVIPVFRELDGKVVVRKEVPFSSEEEARRAAARPYATVLVGRNSPFAERIARILDDTEFHITAQATDVGHLAGVVDQHDALLLVLDASQGVESAVPQVKAFRRLHAEACIVAITRPAQVADMALLFQAGANACLAEDVSAAILLKSLKLLMLGEARIPATVFSERREAQTQSPEQPIGGRVRLPSSPNTSLPQAWN
jgi:DNA-binding NarL/FixJ family response regulator